MLWTVLGINGGMFAAELVVGLLAGSVALLADSLDMLGDNLVYGFSLFAIGRAMHWRARSALFKGSIMAVFGLGVLGQAIYKVFVPETPEAALMGITAFVAFGLTLYAFTCSPAIGPTISTCARPGCARATTSWRIPA